MRYFLIFFAFLVSIEVLGDQYQQQQEQPMRDYNYLSNLYNNLSSLNNQMVQNSTPPTGGNDQGQGIQGATNSSQRFWDPGHWQNFLNNSQYASENQNVSQPDPISPPKSHDRYNRDKGAKHIPPPPSQPSQDSDEIPSYPSNVKQKDDENKDVSDEKKKEEDREEESRRLALGLGLGLGIPATLLILICTFCLYCRYKRKHSESIEGVFNPRNPIIPTTVKYSNSYSATWETPAIIHDDLWAIERDHVVIEYEKKLGTGAFCIVYQGRIIGYAPIRKIYYNLIAINHFVNCDVAVKMLPTFADDIARSDFNQEINFMKSLRYHPHLVSMLGYVPDSRSPLLLVEFCSKGDLLHMIRERKNEIANGYENQSGLKIKDLVSFSWQISNGLEYLNSVGCIHRDVAARNVLVDQRNVCKIGDFGLCRLTDNLLYTARGGRLPLRWMAPESLKSFEYSFKSDVWSYGILLYELFSLGEVPYATIENGHLLDFLESGERLQKPSYCPDEIFQVMLKCWQLQSDERPSFSEICIIFIRILEDATTEYGYVQPIQEEPYQQVDDV